MTFHPNSDDFKKLKIWNMEKDPFAALEDYQPYKEWVRWLKPSHTWQYLQLVIRRKKMQQSNLDLQKYYKNARIGHTLNRWNYLKQRKAWYIPPLNWEKFASKGCRQIIDIGCGDGDVTNRVAQFVAKQWKKNGFNPKSPLTIEGMDINRSRIANATGFCKSPHSNIHMKFSANNAVEKIPKEDKSVDYTMATGVFEALDNPSADKLIKEMERVTQKGIYVEDPADPFPGGFARKELPEMFLQCGFSKVESRTILSEPFSFLRRLDPCWKEMGMPICKIQIIWAER
ncbi:hypothetical protein MTBBW1_2560014 [Desulfamplus magnetovallimortis]|uniref:Methyltransferase domain-containing protein n=1 Tax=Desulfamplus magnetovallimortis TaxID=1246637 RepID=A0A1W1HEX4_9BACT|nr:class I SAM-dependent methyltransferase [Desulfamplus magnetovallimortis]SLM30973.1 hypothetical protein MTBBW1_2560014 [Desulfamplus magnetovallimortis]